jgi:hypothetical protein
LYNTVSKIQSNIISACMLIDTTYAILEETPILPK